MRQTIHLTKLGDSITDATILKVFVAVGQQVTADETILCDYDSDKVDGDILCEYSGTVAEIFIANGQTVPIGAPLFAIETEAAVSEYPLPSPIEAPHMAANEPLPAPQTASSDVQGTGSFSVKKASPVAKLKAKAKKVDIQEIINSVPEERRVVKKDVDRFLEQRSQRIETASPAVAAVAVPPPVTVTPEQITPDFSALGKTEFEELSAVRRATAKHLTQVWTSVPHAWLTEKADITALAIHRKAISGVSWTAIYIKAVVKILKQFPRCNATFDDSARRLVLKKHYHIGVATDTPEGLVVPVVRDADRKLLSEIATDLTLFHEKAQRTGGKKFLPEDFEYRSFTISNVGMFGSTSILPIVNAPDSAILGVTAARTEVLWDETLQQATPRLMLPMTIGFDHRVINGAEASQFLAALKQTLEGPVLGLF